MESFDIDELDRDVKKMTKEMEETIKMGKEGILRYFDRINDKIFSVNNILILAYLGLITFKKDVPWTLLIVPTINFLVLIFIDYRMLNKSRMEANYGDFTSKTVHQYGKQIESTNLISLLCILTTIIEMIIFVKYVS